MSGPTIRKCFEPDIPLPSYKNANLTAGTTYRASSSSRGTQDQEPPRVLLNRDVSYYTKKADEFLQSRLARKTPVINIHYAVPKLSEYASTEADVVWVSGVHLTAPLQMALKVLYHTPINPRGETNLKPLRVDVAYQTEAQLGKEEAVFMIEYKRKDCIDRQEFKDAMEPRVENGRQCERRLRELENDGHWSVLDDKGNALVFMKQATAYHAASQCRYVALCDYESLILICYPEVLPADEDGDILPDLDYAYVTVVEPKDRRKALLGFSMKAAQLANIRPRNLNGN